MGAMGLLHQGKGLQHRNDELFQPLLIRRCSRVPGNRTVLPEGQEHITWVNASFASPYGDIKSAWTKRDDGSVVYKVSVPANTTASLHLQLPSVDATVTENGQAAVKSEGVQSIMFTRNKAVLELESGSYEFVVSGK